MSDALVEPEHALGWNLRRAAAMRDDRADVFQFQVLRRLHINSDMRAVWVRIGFLYLTDSLKGSLTSFFGDPEGFDPIAALITGIGCGDAATDIWNSSEWYDLLQTRDHFSEAEAFKMF